MSLLWPPPNAAPLNQHSPPSFPGMEHELETVVPQTAFSSLNQGSCPGVGKQENVCTAVVEEVREAFGVRGPSRNGLESSSVVVNTVEQSRHPSLQTKGRIMYGTLLWTMFLSGWNDGTTGPLLPRIQTVYHVCLLRCALVFTRSLYATRLALFSCRSSLYSISW